MEDQLVLGSDMMKALTAVQKIDYMTVTDREQLGQGYMMEQEQDVLGLKLLIIFMLYS